MLIFRTPDLTSSCISGLLIVVNVYSYSFDVQNPVEFC